MTYAEAEKLIKADMKLAKADAKVIIQKLCDIYKHLFVGKDSYGMTTFTRANIKRLQDMGVQFMPFNFIHNEQFEHGVNVAVDLDNPDPYQTALDNIGTGLYLVFNVRVQSEYWEFHCALTVAGHTKDAMRITSFVPLSSEVLELACNGDIELELTKNGTVKHKCVNVDEPSDYSDYYDIDEFDGENEYECERQYNEQ